jgi:hypothetical protein
MILWTENRESTRRASTKDELLGAKLRAVDLQLRLRDHRLLRKRVNESLDAGEMQIVARLGVALDAAATASTQVEARVGFDMQAGETVLADPLTLLEIARRPMSEADRAIAEKMPPATS